MKEHFCPAEKTTITYQDKCNWCGESEPQIAFNAEVVGYVAPQRTWVGLTDEEYFEIGQRHWLPSSKVEQIYYEIEAKLKEKNT